MGHRDDNENSGSAKTGGKETRCKTMKFVCILQSVSWMATKIFDLNSTYNFILISIIKYVSLSCCKAYGDEDRTFATVEARNTRKVTLQFSVQDIWSLLL
jgi:hypothetical protein